MMYGIHLTTKHVVGSVIGSNLDSVLRLLLRVPRRLFGAVCIARRDLKFNQYSG